MQCAAIGEPIIFDRYALEDESHNGCDFESNDEDPIDTEDSPEGPMFENAVLEQNSCWHGIMLGNLFGRLKVETYVDAYTENFTKEMASEYSTSKA